METTVTKKYNWRNYLIDEPNQDLNTLSIMVSPYNTFLDEEDKQKFYQKYVDEYETELNRCSVIIANIKEQKIYNRSINYQNDTYFKVLNYCIDKDVELVNKVYSRLIANPEANIKSDLMFNMNLDKNYKVLAVIGLNNIKRRHQTVLNQAKEFYSIKTGYEVVETGVLPFSLSLPDKLKELAVALLVYNQCFYQYNNIAQKFRKSKIDCKYAYFKPFGVTQSKHTKFQSNFINKIYDNFDKKLTEDLEKGKFNFNIKPFIYIPNLTYSVYKRYLPKTFYYKFKLYPRIDYVDYYNKRSFTLIDLDKIKLEYNRFTTRINRINRIREDSNNFDDFNTTHIDYSGEFTSTFFEKDEICKDGTRFIIVRNKPPKDELEFIFHNL